MTIGRQGLDALLADATVQRLFVALGAEGAETRIVGGAVRNALMGFPVHDIDCATTALPQDVLRLARQAGLKAVPTGIDHGTVTIVIEGRPFEVTTLRADARTNGRHAEVVFGSDFEADARRRDFTINALYLDATGTLFDPVGGLPDIAARKVRFIGDALARIREDYLRIMRFFRFHAAYGEGTPDRDGFLACIRGREGLDRLSRERVRAELLRLLGARNAATSLEAMSAGGLLHVILGGVPDHGRFARAAAASDDTLLRLCALAVMVPEDAERLRERLRLSKAEFERLHKLVGLTAHLHGRVELLSERDIRRLAVKHTAPMLADAVMLTAGETTPRLASAAAELLTRYLSGSEPVPSFPFSGAQLAGKGVEPGPRMGVILHKARDLWLEADCPADRAVLDFLLTEAIGQDDSA